MRNELADLPDQGRFDIAVWGPGSTGILGIVEIKEVTFVTYANVKRDVERVCNALTQTESYSGDGCVVCVLVGWEREGRRTEGGAQKARNPDRDH